MGLQEQTLSFRFSGGVDRKSDPKGVLPVRLLDLQNGVFFAAGSIRKRNGYESLSLAVAESSSPLSGVRRLARRDDELLAFTSNRAYAKAISEWIDAGAVIAPLGSDAPAVRTGTEQSAPDMATASGLTAYAWEDSRGGVYWAAVDSSGRFTRGPEQLDANGQRPRCVAVGAGIHVYWARPTNTAIYVAVVNPSRPAAAVTARLLVEDLSSTNPVFDACATDRTGTPAAIAWHENGSTSIRLGYVDASGVLGSPSTGHPSIYTDTGAAMSSASPLAIDYLDEQIAYAYHVNAESSAIQGVVVDSPDDTTAIAPSYAGNLGTATLIKRIAVAFAGSKVWIAAEENATEASEHFCVVGYFDEDSNEDHETLRSVGLASSAFAQGDDAFAVFVHDTTYFNTYLTLRLSDFAPVGRHSPGAAAGLPTRTHTPRVSVSSSVATFALPYRERLLSENNDKFTETGVRRYSLDFDSEDSHQYAQLGRGLYLAGACPLHYDGRTWTEQGFHVGPEKISAAKATGGSLTSSVTYLYRVWYEWTDTQGEIHRGPVSIGTEVVMGASDTKVTLTLPTLRVTKKENVRICVARSLADDETRLFRVTSSDPNTDGDDNGYVANDATADSVTFVDLLSDDDIQEEEPIYTGGGILSNDPAPLGSIVFGAKSRLFFTDSGDANTVRYSQELAVGYGAECPPELQIPCDPFGGAITALGSMDGLVFAFKESAIFVAGGDGPLANGDSSQSGFTSFQLLTSDVGCTDPSSIALTPVGLMFKSAKGIYLIGRDRSVSYVGAPVEAYNSQSVRRATVLPDRTAVVFLTDSGTTLFYDHFFGQWSTFTNHEGRDACVVDGRYHYLRNDERVFRETLSVYLDDNARIPLVIETAWLHLVQHLQGWQVFWYMHLLGAWKSAHQLLVRMRLDYSEQWSDPGVLDATGLAAGATGWLANDNNPIGDEPLAGSVYGEGAYGDGPYGGSPSGLYQFRAHVGATGQSIQFRFEDFEADGFAGASFELSELALTGGIEASTRRPFSAGRSI